jgi:hypothetical protein
LVPSDAVEVDSRGDAEATEFFTTDYTDDTDPSDVPLWDGHRRHKRHIIQRPSGFVPLVAILRAQGFPSMKSV